MSKTYSPTEIEGKNYKFWENTGYFHPEVDDRESYCIVIPPPNVTGALHLGHALNNTIQDVLIRFNRMQQLNTCWIPGTDHAGIATQSVVERNLYKNEKKTRHDIGREALLEKIWEWKKTYGNRIINQLKKLGCSCDWDRTCFTMDENLSYAVRVVFLQLFKEGLIYKGKRLINWCPGCRTALSNDELEYEEVKAKMWQIKYPVKDSDEFIIVATTRPETMLGDTAVAVHSSDERYKHLVGKKCILPLMQKEIPIIADDILADPQKGTGAVKVTPGHDPNDYATGLRNNLEMINILNEDGTLNENAGVYKDLTVQEGRKKVLQNLEKLGLLGKIEDITHPVAHCYRSKDVVEPYLSNQWFVKMAPLVELAKKAVLDKEVTFFPGSRTNDYLHWLDRTPDWCISRQIWWGHRIPIWYCSDCNNIEFNDDNEPISIPETAKAILPSIEDPKSTPSKCPDCNGNNLIQDPDVLDTWFSSQLWPFSTLGWPKKTKELESYYPTNVLVTARDIIALWVARMVMMGMKFLGVKPFSHVFIHGTIQDEHGDIMSKSRGNGFDPVKIIEGGTDHIKAEKALENAPKNRVEHYPAYGCDSLRFGLMSMTSGQGQDIRILVNRDKIKEEDGIPHYNIEIPLFEEGKRFCNKMWQAANGVILRNCENLESTTEPSPFIEDKWLCDKLHNVVKKCTAALQNYRIGENCSVLYHFFWDDLCSWYLEVIKTRLWGEHGEESKKYAQNSLIKASQTFLKLLHPVMPFISEEIWQELRSILPKEAALEEACIIAKWPDSQDYSEYPKEFEVTEIARNITSAINNIRTEQKIKPHQKIPKAILTSNSKELLDKLDPLFHCVKKLTKSEEIIARVDVEKPKNAATRVIEGISSTIIIYIPLEGLIDFEKEKEKLNKEIAKMQELIDKLEKKLANENYTSKAPSHIVKRDRDNLEKYQEQRDQLKQQLADIC